MASRRTAYYPEAPGFDLNLAAPTAATPELFLSPTASQRCRTDRRGSPLRTADARALIHRAQSRPPFFLYCRISPAYAIHGKPTVVDNIAAGPGPAPHHNRLCPRGQSIDAVSCHPSPSGGNCSSIKTRFVVFNSITAAWSAHLYLPPSRILPLRAGRARPTMAACGCR